jgi:hypothetical protein
MATLASGSLHGDPLAYADNQDRLTELAHTSNETSPWMLQEGF